MDLDDWTKMWKESYKMLKPANLRENILKMFYRWHYTPVRLAKISEGSSNICWKCKKNAGTYYHMWWTCEKVKIYWTQVWDLAKEITQQKLVIKPEMTLLNIISGVNDNKLKHCLMYILTAARLLWAQKWKTEEFR